MSKVFFGIRIPRALTALILGGALSVAGLIMQTFFRNPLAGPSVLGLTSGASLGVAIAVMAGTAFGLESFWANQINLVGFAVVGGMAALLIILAASIRVRSNTTLLILGLMLGYITSSVVSVLASFSGERELKQFVHWGFGSFGKVDSYFTLVVLFGLIMGLIILVFTMHRKLNVWMLGETYAKSVGLNVQRTRWVMLVVAGLLTALVTAFCGPIAFLGLAVPHLTRGWFKTSNHSVLIPGCLLMGTALALFCDIVAKVPGNPDLVLPLNAVTSAIGAPIVIVVLLRNRRVM